MRICFWSIARVLNKCEETWRYLEEFDIIGLTETWLEEESWKRLENKLLNKYTWCNIAAIKKDKKGRAKGGIIMAVSKELKDIKIRKINRGALEVGFIIYNNKRWRVVNVV